MEYLQRCFYKSTNWNEDNIFSNITATSQALLEFPIPNGIRVDTSSKSTQHLASSFSLSNYHSINGSLAYLYSSVPLTNTMGTKEISLQDAIAGFRIIEPYATNNRKRISPKQYNRSSLLYGRMYFPGSALEAMIIKRITDNTQLLIKTISNPHLDKNATMIVYLQNNTAKYLREFIYSTNESLLGFRCLYNFGTSSHQHVNPVLIPRFDNSVISVGTEIWYAARTMSPGLSTAFRYSTRSTSTGKPLTMTLAINPIIGHISSSYTVKTSVASTFCSRYDFNWYSYASNLSLGFELYNYGKKNNFPTFENHDITVSSRENNHLRSYNHGHLDSQPVPISPYKHHSRVVMNPIESLDNEFRINPQLLTDKSKAQPNHTNETVTTAFQLLVNESDFSSVLKFSTSLNDKMIKLLWEGKCKDFLVSTGMKMGLNPVTHIPEITKIGIGFSYSF